MLMSVAKYRFGFCLLLLSFSCQPIWAKRMKQPLPVIPEVERWGVYETSYTACVSDDCNPFAQTISATFVGPDTLRVEGYYDGDDRWKVRFMPTSEGMWTYTIHSGIAALNGLQGTLLCVAPAEGNHGPVQVDSTGLNFCYADGSRYYPIGTTSYDWMHASSNPSVSTADAGLTMQQQTLLSLGETGFTKIRSLLLPQNFNRDYPEPEQYPFVRTAEGWDWTRLNPRYFDHVEECTRALMSLGIEQDLILFHPYDGGRWGFSAMPVEAGELLCRYVGARMSSMRNVWWSLANEYDLIKEQTPASWSAWTDAILAADPYHHLISIHSYTAQYYSYWDERYTHCSIQDQAPVEDFGRAATVRNIYRKPVVFDEVLYEGDMQVRWGCLSGEEMLHRFYQALIAGTYCTHSECYQFGDPSSFRYNFLAVGGKFSGSMWARTKFLKSLLDDMPMPMYLADSSWDPRTSACGPGYYMVYMGREVHDQWIFDLPLRNGRTPAYPRIEEGEQYEVEIIDTWNMTIERYPVLFETVKQDSYRAVDREHRVVVLPRKPYLLLRIKRISK